MLNCLAAASIAASASVASTSPSHLALAQRNRSSNVTVTVLTHPETPAQRPHRLAGAPGFEPGNGGIKIRKRPLICKGFPVSCCICVALGNECAPCHPQSSL